MKHSLDARHTRIQEPPGNRLLDFGITNIHRYQFETRVVYVRQTTTRSIQKPVDDRHPIAASEQMGDQG
jgi:hypothetical protein